MLLMSGTFQIFVMRELNNKTKLLDISVCRRDIINDSCLDLQYFIRDELLINIIFFVKLVMVDWKCSLKSLTVSKLLKLFGSFIITEPGRNRP